MGNSDVPVGTVQYSAHAYGEGEGLLPDPIWGHEMPVLADGFEDVEEARAWARRTFERDQRADYVVILEQIKVDHRVLGYGWKQGRTVERVNR